MSKFSSALACGESTIVSRVESTIREIRHVGMSTLELQHCTCVDLDASTMGRRLRQTPVCGIEKADPRPTGDPVAMTDRTPEKMSGGLDDGVAGGFFILPEVESSHVWAMPRPLIHRICHAASADDLGHRNTRLKHSTTVFSPGLVCRASA